MRAATWLSIQKRGIIGVMNNKGRRTVHISQEKRKKGRKNRRKLGSSTQEHNITPFLESCYHATRHQIPCNTCQCYPTQQLNMPLPTCGGVNQLGSRAITPKVGVPEVDKAAIGTAGVMGGGAFVMGVLSAETPLTGLPQRALLHRMSRFVSAAPETIWKLGLNPVMSLAQDCTALQVILSWLYVRWPLGCEDAWDALTARGEEGGHRRRGRAGN